MRSNLLRAAVVARPLRPVLLAPLALALLAAACSDNATAPPTRTPTAMTIISGHDQVVAPDVAAEPFVVQVNDQDGQGLPNVTVTWAVTEWSGTLSATTSITNEAGQASVTLTADDTGNAVVVTATVGSLTPAAFTVTVNVEDTDAEPEA